MVLICNKGERICEWYSDNEAQIVETMSVTKSITGIVIGRLLAQGKITSLDQSVSAFFPEWLDTPKQQITIRQLMAHSSGLADQLTTEEIYASKDIVKLALKADLWYSPGQFRFYSNKAVNLLPAIVEPASGQQFTTYVENELFAPLQISRYSWQKDEAGNYFGFAGLHLNAPDLAKLGQLMLQNGEWDGTQLLTEDFVSQSVSQQHIDYGLLWWVYDGPPATYAALGYNGQALIVCPSAQLVCVRQIDCKRFKAEEDNFYELVDLIMKLADEIQKQEVEKTIAGNPEAK